MGLKPTFKMADVRALLNRRLEALDEAILNSLSYLGEKCVIQARSLNTYKDQTGNLRNSVGYVIVHNGRIVRRSFTRSATVKNEAGRKTKGSKDGVLIGRTLATELAKEHTTGWALIVVAGMNYALQVETRGRDVLTSAEQLAQTELPRMLKVLKADVAK